MRKHLLLILAALAVAAVSVAAYYRSTEDSSPQFATAPVTRGEVVETVEATGTLEAVETVEVGTQVSGTIRSLDADFNSEVKQGQVIARLDPSLFQTQVEQAQASLVRLQADADRARVEVDDTAMKLRRAHELWDQQLIPRTDLETAEANARQAEAAIKSAQAQVAQARASLNQNQVNLDHTIIRAPIDGIVISRNVEVGQTVAASMSAPTLFVIARDLAHMQVSARIDESDIGRIALRQLVTFKVDAYPRDTFTGNVSQVRLQPIVESNVVSYVTIIDVPNRDLKLKPGMTANVTVQVARADDVLRVPSSALRFRPNGTSQEPGASGGSPRTGSRDASAARVWVLQGDQPQPVRVQPGINDGTTTAIVGGALAPDDRVITGIVAQNDRPAGSTSPLLPFGGRRPGGNSTRQAGAGGGRGQGAAR